ncbi:MAG: YqiA/YcfP family alpha/beta fold hydrolase [Bacteroidaceae bacterium]
MSAVLYIHGFASAGSSGTAIVMRNMLYPHGVQVISPDVPTSPLQAQKMLHQLVQEIHPKLIVGTSMGAMYAEQIHGVPRILVNPSFHMARLLTFRGMGRMEFRNKREDGAKDFRVDKDMIQEFKQVEKDSFQDVSLQERHLVWGIFGIQDRQVNCQADFRKYYDSAQMRFFEGGHYLNDHVLSREVMPLVMNLLGL